MASSAAPSTSQPPSSAPIIRRPSPRKINPPPRAALVTSVEDLVAALSSPSINRIRLAQSGSPYRLSSPLHVSREVLIEGEIEKRGEETILVVVFGFVTLQAGCLSKLEIRPGSVRVDASTPRGDPPPTATVEILGTLDGKAAVPSLQHVVIHAPNMGLITARPQLMGTAPPPRPNTSPPKQRQSQSPRAEGMMAEASASPDKKKPPPPSSTANTNNDQNKPLALRICAGARARVAFCTLRGGVLVLERSSPLLQSCELGGATNGNAAIELRGTSLSCELRDNSIGECSTVGVLITARAAATLADNRIQRCGGAGIEACGGCRELLLLRNTIEEVGGVGLLLHDGTVAEARENVIRLAGASAVEVCGEGTKATLLKNTLSDGRDTTGVGLLIKDGASGLFEENIVADMPLGGVEIGGSACPVLRLNSISRCGQAGVLLAPYGGGTIERNNIHENGKHGIECCSSHHSLHVEGNSITQHKKGTGLLVRSGGGGKWINNTISGNLVGVELLDGACPELLRNKIQGNLREGLTVGDGAVAQVVECTLRGNGNERMVKSSGRRGNRLHGDDAGAGVVVHPGGEAMMRSNVISMNAGVGVFAHSDAKATLQSNSFRGNGGEHGNVAMRPGSTLGVAEADSKSLNPQRAVQPSVVRRQRLPFDSTFGSNVNREDDKSLQDRMAEFRAQFEAMRGDPTKAMDALPPGADPSTVCAVM